VNALLVGRPGVLGWALAAEWLQRGHALWALCPPDAGGAWGMAEFAASPGFRGVVHGAPGDAAALRAVFAERPEACFYLAAEAAPAGAGPGCGLPAAAAREVFVERQGRLLELAETCRAHRARLVFVGGAEVLEGVRGGERQDESWPVRARTPAAAALVAAEQLALSYDHAGGLPVVVCRPFSVYGPLPAGEEEGGVIATFARRAARGERLPVFGDGQQSRDFVHARDVARLLAALGEEARVHGCVVHAASGQETRIAELARRMSAGTGYTFVTHPAPLAEPGRMRGDFSLARRLLGWAPRVDLRAGLREMRAWAAGQAAAARGLRAAS